MLVLAPEASMPPGNMTVALEFTPPSLDCPGASTVVPSIMIVSLLAVVLMEVSSRRSAVPTGGALAPVRIVMSTTRKRGGDRRSGRIGKPAPDVERTKSSIDRIGSRRAADAVWRDGGSCLRINQRYFDLCVTLNWTR